MQLPADRGCLRHAELPRYQVLPVFEQLHQLLELVDLPLEFGAECCDFGGLFTDDLEFAGLRGGRIVSCNGDDMGGVEQKTSGLHLSDRARLTGEGA